MNNAPGKWISTAIIISVNLLLWAPSSDLAYNVAQQRDILLGRYTVEKVITLLLLTLVSAFILGSIWSSKKRKHKRGYEQTESLKRTKVVNISIKGLGIGKFMTEQV
jgi:hypothetical protein